MLPPSGNKVPDPKSLARNKYIRAHTVGYFWVDIDGTILDADESAAERLWRDRSKLVGTLFQNHIPREDEDIFVKHLQQLFQSTSTQTCEISLIRKDGAILHSFLESAVRSDPQTKHDLCMIMVRDTTFVYMLEKELSCENKFSEIVVKSSNDGLVAFDSSCLCTAWNPAMEQMTGITSSDCLGRNIFEVLPFLKRIGEDRYFYAALQGRRVTSRNRHYSVKRTGCEGFFQARYAPVKNDDGELIGGIGIFQDITEQKKKDEEYFKAKALESLGSLTPGIAHDFNNLLSGILGNISLARLYMDEGSKARELIDKATKIALRATHFTRQLTSLTSGGTLIRTPAFIDRLLIDTVNVALSGSNVGCEFAVDDELWPVEIDEGQIRHAIHTIVTHTKESMQEGGKITVSAGNALISPDFGLPLLERKYILISICEQGSAIAVDTITASNDSFSIRSIPADHTGRNAKLAIACSIINNHEGFITGTSTAETSAAYSIFLPATDKIAGKKESEAEPAIIGKGRVLIMDDDEDVREAAGNILSHIGYEVSLAADGEAALREYMDAINSDRPYDAVILDLTVQGGMGGREAVTRLLDVDPDVTAIISSGYSHDPVMKDFTKYGFKAAIAKPFRITELNEIVAQAINRLP